MLLKKPPDKGKGETYSKFTRKHRALEHILVYDLIGIETRRRLG
jgi:hypothetical protein